MLKGFTQEEQKLSEVQERHCYGHKRHYETISRYTGLQTQSKVISSLLGSIQSKQRTPEF